MNFKESFLTSFVRSFFLIVAEERKKKRTLPPPEKRTPDLILSDSRTYQLYSQLTSSAEDLGFCASLLPETEE